MEELEKRIVELTKYVNFLDNTVIELQTKQVETEAKMEGLLRYLRRPNKMTVEEKETFIKETENIWLENKMNVINDRYRLMDQHGLDYDRDSV